MARSDTKTVRSFNHTCCKCDFPYQDVDNFYKSNSSSFSGYLPICKDCLAKKYNEYVIAYQDRRKAMKRICMMWDIYYSDSIFDKCEKEASDSVTLNSYMVKLNKLASARGKTFDTSIEEGFEYEERDDESNPVDDEYDLTGISAATIEMWGEGFKRSEYKTLVDHYKFLKKSNPNCDNNLELFIRDLCYIKMKQMTALRADDMENYNKLTESYRKSFQLSGLKTTQNTDANSDDCWGTWMERISQYTPEEFYKDKKLYKDFDGIGDYFNRFVLRPLKNLMFGTTDRDKEFFVGDDEDVEIEE